MKRAAASAGSDAYQGAFEAVGSVLIACAFGYWVDSRWETAPWGLLIGAVLGFAAMVLRLVRLGKEIHPEASESEDPTSGTSGEATTQRVDGEGVGMGDGIFPGESPGLSSVLREDDARQDGNGKAE